MNQLNNITKKEKLKHLSMEHYDYIQSQYNNFISSKNKVMKKTLFMKQLAISIGTTLSNLYNVINDGIIQVMNYDLSLRTEFSSTVAFEKRTSKSIISNSSKLLSSNDFVSLVINEFRNPNNINSIDEIINDFILNKQDEIEGFETVCTATFYKYIDDNSIDLKASELPMKLRRKKGKKKKIAKRQKGISIDKRPFTPDDRTEFGHWEGDTIVGGSKIPNSGAVLTLVERMTRFQITIPLKDRTAKSVRLAFNKIEKEYNINIKEIFKSITFDNGVEFSDYLKIQKKWKMDIFFAHPYSSWERGSNENGNKILRIFLPKGVNINDYSYNFILNSNRLINNKIRKILGYKSSLSLFTNELAKLAQ